MRGGRGPGQKGGGWWLVAGVEFAAMVHRRPTHRPRLTVNDGEIRVKSDSNYTIHRKQIAIGWAQFKSMIKHHPFCVLGPIGRRGQLPRDLSRAQSRKRTKSVFSTAAHLPSKLKLNLGDSCLESSDTTRATRASQTESMWPPGRWCAHVRVRWAFCGDWGWAGGAQLLLFETRAIVWLSPQATISTLLPMHIHIIPKSVGDAIGEFILERGGGEVT